MREDPCIKSPVLYLQHQYELLQIEYEYEKEQFKQQTELMGIGRKIKRGMCWYPLNLGRNYYNALNQLVIEVERREDKDIEHQFEYGRPVCFFTQDVSGKLNYLNFVATVNYVDEDRMVVILPSVDALLTLQSKEVVGVQLYFDETSYRLMFEALKQVIGAKNNRLAELRDIFHGTQPASTFSFHPLRFPWLNATQEEAVNKVLHAKDVAIVHGPPGTGKTTTLVEAVYETLHRENQVLVCAQSNMAVDWISEKLVDRGVSVLRIGNPSRVNDKMLSFTYERRFESHPDYPQLWSIRKAIRELYARSRKGAEREAVRQKINSLKDRATELEIRLRRVSFCRRDGAESHTFTYSVQRLVILMTSSAAGTTYFIAKAHISRWEVIPAALSALSGPHTQPKKMELISAPPFRKIYDVTQSNQSKETVETEFSQASAAIMGTTHYYYK